MAEGDDMGALLGRRRFLRLEVHSRELRKLGRAIRTKHPKLEVELLLMSLDGSVETIA